MNIAGNKKIILLSVLAVFAVVSLIYGMSAGSGRPKTKEASKPAAQTPKSAVSAPADDTGTMRRAKRTKFTAWHRSPFVPTPADGGSYAGVKLSGIIASGKELKAVMGDVIVVKGDKIQGSTVVEVRKDSVILNDGAKTFEVKLEQ